jgi:hypothetical protein
VRVIFIVQKIKYDYRIHCKYKNVEKIIHPKAFWIGKVD